MKVGRPADVYVVNGDTTLDLVACRQMGGRGNRIMGASTVVVYTWDPEKLFNDASIEECLDANVRPD